MSKLSYSFSPSIYLLYIRTITAKDGNIPFTILTTHGPSLPKTKTDHTLTCHTSVMLIEKNNTYRHYSI